MLTLPFDLDEGLIRWRFRDLMLGIGPHPFCERILIAALKSKAPPFPIRRTGRPKFNYKSRGNRHSPWLSPPHPSIQIDQESNFILLDLDGVARVIEDYVDNS